MFLHLILSPRSVVCRPKPKDFTTSLFIPIKKSQERSKLLANGTVEWGGNLEILEKRDNENKANPRNIGTATAASATPLTTPMYPEFCEKARGAKIIVETHRDKNGEIVQIYNPKLNDMPGGAVDSRDRAKAFVFDYAYTSLDPTKPGYASQQLIFQDLGTDVVQQAFEGFNGCVFAYGQTGSGKTYTMMGEPNDVGLIPRICESLFNRMDEEKQEAQAAEKVSFKINVSYMEIYNERVRDLLPSSTKRESYTLKVREHPKDGPFVEGLRKHSVKDNDGVQVLISRGNENRTTAATHFHDRSSRSHAIFTLSFTQAKFDQESQMPYEIVSKIRLVDLAGSERADSGHKYDKGTLKEASSINKSLVTLGNVIVALADRSLQLWSTSSRENLCGSAVDINVSSPGASTEQLCQAAPGTRRPSISASQKKFFIPYRDSVLTWLLKDSLGGNVKTVMIATVSPTSLYYGETLSTLRYAQRAKNIVNKPVINEDANAKTIRELREEIMRLQQLLAAKWASGSVSSISETSSYIQDRMEENKDKAQQLTSRWMYKWQEAQELMKEQCEKEEESDMSIQPLRLGKRSTSLGVLVDSHLPHLVGLSGDPLSTGVMMYHLKEGKTRVGSDTEHGAELDIYLSGEDVLTEHCVIRHINGGVTLHPNQGAYITVNDRPVTSPVKLSQGDTVFLGRHNMFRFNNPVEAARLREQYKQEGGTEKRMRVLSRSNSTSSMGTQSEVSFSLDGEASPYSSEPPSPLHQKSVDMERAGAGEADELSKIENARRELERLRAEQEEACNLRLEREDELFQRHEQQKRELEEEKARLRAQMQQYEQERAQAELEIEEQRRQLREDQANAETLMAERLSALERQYDESAVAATGRFPVTAMSDLGTLALNTDSNLSGILGQAKGTPFSGSADPPHSLDEQRRLIEAQKAELESRKHELEAELRQKQAELDDMFTASSEQLELQKRHLSEKERNYKKENQAAMESVAMQTDLIEQLEHKQVQLVHYIEAKQLDLEGDVEMDESSDFSLRPTMGSANSDDSLARDGTEIDPTSGAPRPRLQRRQGAPGQPVLGSRVRSTSAGDASAKPPLPPSKSSSSLGGVRPKTRPVSSTAEEVTNRLYPGPKLTPEQIAQRKRELEAARNARNLPKSKSVPTLRGVSKRLKQLLPGLRKSSSQLAGSSSSLPSVPETADEELARSSPNSPRRLLGGTDSDMDNDGFLQSIEKEPVRLRPRAIAKDNRPHSWAAPDKNQNTRTSLHFGEHLDPIAGGDSIMDVVGDSDEGFLLSPTSLTSGDDSIADDKFDPKFSVRESPDGREKSDGPFRSASSSPSHAPAVQGAQVDPADPSNQQQLKSSSSTFQPPTSDLTGQQSKGVSPSADSDRNKSKNKTASNTSLASVSSTASQHSSSPKGKRKGALANATIKDNANKNGVPPSGKKKTSSPRASASPALGASVDVDKSPMAARRGDRSGSRGRSTRSPASTTSSSPQASPTPARKAASKATPTAKSSTPTVSKSTSEKSKPRQKPSSQDDEQSSTLKRPHSKSKVALTNSGPTTDEKPNKQVKTEEVPVEIYMPSSSTEIPPAVTIKPTTVEDMEMESQNEVCVVDDGTRYIRRAKPPADREQEDENGQYVLVSKLPDGRTQSLGNESGTNTESEIQRTWDQLDRVDSAMKLKHLLPRNILKFMTGCTSGMTEEEVAHYNGLNTQELQEEYHQALAEQLAQEERHHARQREQREQASEREKRREQELLAGRSTAELQREYLAMLKRQLAYDEGGAEERFSEDSLDEGGASGSKTKTSGSKTKTSGNTMWVTAAGARSSSSPDGLAFHSQSPSSPPLKSGSNSVDLSQSAPSNNPQLRSGLDALQSPAASLPQALLKPAKLTFYYRAGEGPTPEDSSEAGEPATQPGDQASSLSVGTAAANQPRQRNEGDGAEPEPPSDVTGVTHKATRPRTRRRTQLQQGEPTESESGQQTDDSLLSGDHKRPSSRPGSSTQRRRRHQPRTPSDLSADATSGVTSGASWRRETTGGMSSEEYVSSEEDGVSFSEDSLASDERILATGSGVAGSTVADTADDMDVTELPLDEVRHVTSAIDSMTSALNAPESPQSHDSQQSQGVGEKPATDGDVEIMCTDIEPDSLSESQPPTSVSMDTAEIVSDPCVSGTEQTPHLSLQQSNREADVCSPLGTNPIDTGSGGGGQGGSGGDSGDGSGGSNDNIVDDPNLQSTLRSTGALTNEVDDNNALNLNKAAKQLSRLLVSKILVWDNSRSLLQPDRLSPIVESLDAHAPEQTSDNIAHNRDLSLEQASTAVGNEQCCIETHQSSSTDHQSPVISSNSGQFHVVSSKMGEDSQSPSSIDSSTTSPRQPAYIAMTSPGEQANRLGPIGKELPGSVHSEHFKSVKERQQHLQATVVEQWYANSNESIDNISGKETLSYENNQLANVQVLNVNVSGGVSLEKGLHPVAITKEHDNLIVKDTKPETPGDRSPDSLRSRNRDSGFYGHHTGDSTSQACESDGQSVSESEHDSLDQSGSVFTGSQISSGLGSLPIPDSSTSSSEEQAELRNTSFSASTEVLVASSSAPSIESGSRDTDTCSQVSGESADRTCDSLPYDSCDTTLEANDSASPLGTSTSEAMQYIVQRDLGVEEGMVESADMQTDEVMENQPVTSAGDMLSPEQSQSTDNSAENKTQSTVIASSVVNEDNRCNNELLQDTEQEMNLENAPLKTQDQQSMTVEQTGSVLTPGLDQASPSSVASQLQDQPNIASQLQDQPNMATQLWDQPNIASQLQDQPNMASQLQDQPKMASQLQAQPNMAAQLQDQPKMASQLQAQPNMAAQLQDQPNLASQLQDQPNLASQLQDQSNLASQLQDQPNIASQLQDQPNLASQLQDPPNIASQLQDQPNMASQLQNQPNLASQQQDQSHNEEAHPSATEKVLKAISHLSDYLHLQKRMDTDSDSSIADPAGGTPRRHIQDVPKEGQEELDIADIPVQEASKTIKLEPRIRAGTLEDQKAANDKDQHTALGSSPLKAGQKTQIGVTEHQDALGDVSTDPDPLKQEDASLVHSAAREGLDGASKDIESHERILPDQQLSGPISGCISEATMGVESISGGETNAEIEKRELELEPQHELMEELASEQLSLPSIDANASEIGVKRGRETAADVDVATAGSHDSPLSDANCGTNQDEDVDLSEKGFDDVMAGRMEIAVESGVVDMSTTTQVSELYTAMTGAQGDASDETSLERDRGTMDEMPCDEPRLQNTGVALTPQGNPVETVQEPKPETEGSGGIEPQVTEADVTEMTSQSAVQHDSSHSSLSSPSETSYSEGVAIINDSENSSGNSAGPVAMEHCIECSELEGTTVDEREMGKDEEDVEEEGELMDLSLSHTSEQHSRPVDTETDTSLTTVSLDHDEQNINAAAANREGALGEKLETQGSRESIDDTTASSCWQQPTDNTHSDGVMTSDHMASDLWSDVPQTPQAGAVVVEFPRQTSIERESVSESASNEIEMDRDGNPQQDVYSSCAELDNSLRDAPEIQSESVEMETDSDAVEDGSGADNLKGALTSDSVSMVTDSRLVDESEGQPISRDPESSEIVIESSCVSDVDLSDKEQSDISGRSDGVTSDRGKTFVATQYKSDKEAMSQDPDSSKIVTEWSCVSDVDLSGKNQSDKLTDEVTSDKDQTSVDKQGDEASSAGAEHAKADPMDTDSQSKRRRESSSSESDSGNAKPKKVSAPIANEDGCRQESKIETADDSRGQLDDGTSSSAPSNDFNAPQEHADICPESVSGNEENNQERYEIKTDVGIVQVHSELSVSEHTLVHYGQAVQENAFENTVATDSKDPSDQLCSTGNDNTLRPQDKNSRHNDEKENIQGNICEQTLTVEPTETSRQNQQVSESPVPDTGESNTVPGLAEKIALTCTKQTSPELESIIDNQPETKADSNEINDTSNNAQFLVQREGSVENYQEIEANLDTDNLTNEETVISSTGNVSDFTGPDNKLITEGNENQSETGETLTGPQPITGSQVQLSSYSIEPLSEQELIDQSCLVTSSLPEGENKNRDKSGNYSNTLLHANIDPGLEKARLEEEKEVSGEGVLCTGPEHIEAVREIDENTERVVVTEKSNKDTDQIALESLALKDNTSLLHEHVGANKLGDSSENNVDSNKKNTNELNSENYALDNTQSISLAETERHFERESISLEQHSLLQESESQENPFVHSQLNKDEIETQLLIEQGERAKDIAQDTSDNAVESVLQSVLSPSTQHGGSLAANSLADDNTISLAGNAPSVTLAEGEAFQNDPQNIQGAENQICVENNNQTVTVTELETPSSGPKVVSVENKSTPGGNVSQAESEGPNVIITDSEHVKLVAESGEPICQQDVSAIQTEERSVIENHIQTHGDEKEEDHNIPEAKTFDYLSPSKEPSETLNTLSSVPNRLSKDLEKDQAPHIDPTSDNTSVNKANLGDLDISDDSQSVVKESVEPENVNLSSENVDSLTTDNKMEVDNVNGQDGLDNNRNASQSMKVKEQISQQPQAMETDVDAIMDNNDTNNNVATDENGDLESQGQNGSHDQAVTGLSSPGSSASIENGANGETLEDHSSPKSASQSANRGNSTDAGIQNGRAEASGSGARPRDSRLHPLHESTPLRPASSADPSGAANSTPRFPHLGAQRRLDMTEVTQPVSVDTSFDEGYHSVMLSSPHSDYVDDYIRGLNTSSRTMSDSEQLDTSNLDSQDVVDISANGGFPIVPPLDLSDITGNSRDSTPRYNVVPARPRNTRQEMESDSRFVEVMDSTEPQPQVSHESSRFISLNASQSSLPSETEVIGAEGPEVVEDSNMADYTEQHSTPPMSPSVSPPMSPRRTPRGRNKSESDLKQAELDEAIGAQGVNQSTNSLSKSELHLQPACDEDKELFEAKQNEHDSMSETEVDPGNFQIVHYKAPEPKRKRKRKSKRDKKERARELVPSEMAVLRNDDIDRLEEQLVERGSDYTTIRSSEEFPAVEPTNPRQLNRNASVVVNVDDAEMVDDLTEEEIRLIRQQTRGQHGSESHPPVSLPSNGAESLPQSSQPSLPKCDSLVVNFDGRDVDDISEEEIAMLSQKQPGREKTVPPKPKRMKKSDSVVVNVDDKDLDQITEEEMQLLTESSADREVESSNAANLPVVTTDDVERVCGRNAVHKTASMVVNCDPGDMDDISEEEVRIIESERAVTRDTLLKPTEIQKQPSIETQIDDNEEVEEISDDDIAFIRRGHSNGESQPRSTGAKVSFLIGDEQEQEGDRIQRMIQTIEQERQSLQGEPIPEQPLQVDTDNAAAKVETGREARQGDRTPQTDSAFGSDYTDHTQSDFTDSETTFSPQSSRGKNREKPTGDVIDTQIPTQPVEAVVGHVSLNQSSEPTLQLKDGTTPKRTRTSSDPTHENGEEIIRTVTLAEANKADSIEEIHQIPNDSVNSARSADGKQKPVNFTDTKVIGFDVQPRRGGARPASPESELDGHDVIIGSSRKSSYSADESKRRVTADVQILGLQPPQMAPQLPETVLTDEPIQIFHRGFVRAGLTIEVQPRERGDGESLEGCTSMTSEEDERASLAQRAAEAEQRRAEVKVLVNEGQDNSGAHKDGDSEVAEITNDNRVMAPVKNNEEDDKYRSDSATSVDTVIERASPSAELSTADEQQQSDVSTDSDTLSSGAASEVEAEEMAKKKATKSGKTKTKKKTKSAENLASKGVKIPKKRTPVETELSLEQRRIGHMTQSDKELLGSGNEMFEDLAPSFADLPKAGLDESGASEVLSPKTSARSMDEALLRRYPSEEIPNEGDPECNDEYSAQLSMFRKAGMITFGSTENQEETEVVETEDDEDMPDGERCKSLEVLASESDECLAERLGSSDSSIGAGEMQVPPLSLDTLASLSSESLEGGGEAGAEGFDQMKWIERVSEMPDVISSHCEELRESWLSRYYRWHTRSLSMSELEVMDRRDWYDGIWLSANCLDMIANTSPNRAQSSDSITYFFFNEARSLDNINMDQTRPEKMTGATSEPDCAKKELRHKYGIDEAILPFKIDRAASLDILDEPMSQEEMSSRQRSQSIDDSNWLSGDVRLSPDLTPETVFGGPVTENREGSEDDENTTMFLQGSVKPRTRTAPPGDDIIVRPIANDEPVRLRRRRQGKDGGKRVSWGDVEEKLTYVGSPIDPSFPAIDDVSTPHGMVLSSNDIGVQVTLPGVGEVAGVARVQDAVIREESETSSSAGTMSSTTEAETVVSVHRSSSSREDTKGSKVSVSSEVTDAQTSPIPFDETAAIAETIDEVEEPIISPRSPRVKPKALIDQALATLREAMGSQTEINVVDEKEPAQGTPIRVTHHSTNETQTPLASSTPHRSMDEEMFARESRDSQAEAARLQNGQDAFTYADLLSTQNLRHPVVERGHSSLVGQNAARAAIDMYEINSNRPPQPVGRAQPMRGLSEYFPTPMSAWEEHLNQQKVLLETREQMIRAEEDERRSAQGGTLSREEQMRQNFRDDIMRRSLGGFDTNNYGMYPPEWIFAQQQQQQRGYPRTIETQTDTHQRVIETQTDHNERVIETQTSPRYISKAEFTQTELFEYMTLAVLTDNEYDLAISTQQAQALMVDMGCNPSPPRGHSPLEWAVQTDYSMFVSRTEMDCQTDPMPEPEIPEPEIIFRREVLTQVAPPHVVVEKNSVACQTNEDDRPFQTLATFDDRTPSLSSDDELSSASLSLSEDEELGVQIDPEEQTAVKSYVTRRSPASAQPTNASATAANLRGPGIQSLMEEHEKLMALFNKSATDRTESIKRRQELKEKRHLQVTEELQNVSQSSLNSSFQDRESGGNTSSQYMAEAESSLTDHDRSKSPDVVEDEDSMSLSDEDPETPRYKREMAANVFSKTSEDHTESESTRQSGETLLTSQDKVGSDETLVAPSVVSSTTSQAQDVKAHALRSQYTTDEGEESSCRDQETRSSSRDLTMSDTFQFQVVETIPDEYSEDMVDQGSVTYVEGRDGESYVKYREDLERRQQQAMRSSNGQVGQGTDTSDCDEFFLMPREAADAMDTGASDSENLQKLQFEKIVDSASETEKESMTRGLQDKHQTLNSASDLNVYERSSSVLLSTVAQSHQCSANTSSDFVISASRITESQQCSATTSSDFVASAGRTQTRQSESRSPILNTSASGHLGTGLTVSTSDTATAMTSLVVSASSPRDRPPSRVAATQYDAHDVTANTSNRIRTESSTQYDLDDSFEAGASAVLKADNSSTSPVSGQRPQDINAIIEKYQTIKKLVEYEGGASPLLSQRGGANVTIKIETNDGTSTSNSSQNHKRYDSGGRDVSFDVSIDTSFTESEMKDESISTDMTSDEISDELERLRRERQRISEMLARESMPSRLQVELAEAQLNYIIGQTDTLLTTIDEPLLDFNMEILEKFSGYPEEELSELSRKYLTQYRSTLERSKVHIDDRIKELERQKSKANRTRARNRQLAKLRREAAVEAFKLERQREENLKHIAHSPGASNASGKPPKSPRSPRSRSASPTRRLQRATRVDYKPPPSPISPISPRNPLPPLSAKFLTPKQRQQHLANLRKGIVKYTDEERSRSISPAISNVSSPATTPRSNSHGRLTGTSGYSPYRSTYLAQRDPSPASATYLPSPLSAGGSRVGFTGSSIGATGGQLYYEAGRGYSLYGDSETMSIGSLDEDSERLLGDAQRIKRSTHQEIEKARQALDQKSPREIYMPGASPRVTSTSLSYTSSVYSSSPYTSSLYDRERRDRIEQEARRSTTVSALRTRSTYRANDQQIDYEIEELKRKYGMMSRDSATSGSSTNQQRANSHVASVMDRYTPRGASSGLTGSGSAPFSPASSLSAYPASPSLSRRALPPSPGLSRRSVGSPGVGSAGPSGGVGQSGAGLGATTSTGPTPAGLGRTGASAFRPTPTDPDVRPKTST